MGQAATPTATHPAGIDVSEDARDACLLGPDGTTRSKAFADDPKGHAARLAWADRLAPGAAAHVCLEATGPYSEAIATHLAGAGRLVSVANPARVRAHAGSTGQGSKTDPADARAIAEYARDRKPRPWSPPPPEVRRVQALVRRREELRVMAAAEKDRLDAPGRTPAARKGVARVIKLLTKEADRVAGHTGRVAARLAGVVPRPHPCAPVPPNDPAHLPARPALRPRQVQRLVQRDHLLPRRALSTRRIACGVSR